MRIEGKDILVYDVTQEEIEDIRNIKDLRRLKGKTVIAPHPYYVKGQCLGKLLVKYIDIFDAIEHCIFYYSFINPNKKAKRIAKKFGKPMVANSDAHRLWQIGQSYSLVDSIKEKDAVLKAIKAGKVKIVSNPMSFFRFMELFWMAIKRTFIGKVY